MKLEVGKKYKDEFNAVFTIISDQAKPPYKYVGQSITTGALIGFTYDGQSAHCSGGLVQEVQGSETMSFELELANFIAALKQKYGHKPLLKSIELHDELYQRVEFELLTNTGSMQPGLDGAPVRVIQFYYHGENIYIKCSDRTK